MCEACCNFFTALYMGFYCIFLCIVQYICVYTLDLIYFFIYVISCNRECDLAVCRIYITEFVSHYRKVISLLLHNYDYPRHRL